MIIGIPKEIMAGENRVAAIPETVQKMVNDGATVLVEYDAGKGAYYDNQEYLDAGAKLVANPQEIFDQADVILKVKEPQFNKNLNKHEADMLHKDQYLITFIHPASPSNHEMVKRLRDNGIISLTLDGVPRISRAQSMDALSSMSTCAGYKGMIMAINNIPKFAPLIGSAVGMIKPANVFVIGTGVAGLRAIATAKGLGAVVYAADIRPDACEQARSLGAKIIELDVPEKVALSKDGKYAQQLPEKYLVQEREKIKDAVKNADVIFLSALVPGKIAPILITDEMVASMQPGSCIVDISIDQGGNCEITTPGVRDIKHGVIIEGIKNIPGMLPRSSTYMFAHNIYNLLKYLTKDQKIVLDLKDEIVESILVTKDYKLLHSGTLEAMGLRK